MDVLVKGWTCVSLTLQTAIYTYNQLTYIHLFHLSISTFPLGSSFETRFGTALYFFVVIF